MSVRLAMFLSTSHIKIEVSYLLRPVCYDQCLSGGFWSCWQAATSASLLGSACWTCFGQRLQPTTSMRAVRLFRYPTYNIAKPPRPAHMLLLHTSSCGMLHGSLKQPALLDLRVSVARRVDCTGRPIPSSGSRRQVVPSMWFLGGSAKRADVKQEVMSRLQHNKLSSPNVHYQLLPGL